MQVERRGRRLYLLDLDPRLYETAKAVGCNWDNEAKAWWTAKAATLANVELAEDELDVEQEVADDPAGHRPPLF